MSDVVFRSEYASTISVMTNSALRLMSPFCTGLVNQGNGESCDELIFRKMRAAVENERQLPVKGLSITQQ
jgi:hypothetical protein